MTMGAEQSNLQHRTVQYHHDEYPSWTSGPLWSAVSSLVSGSITSLLSSFDSGISSSNNTSSSQRTDTKQPERRSRKWRLQLPIFGEIALRRAIARGEDPFDLERKQRSQLEHEYHCRFGPLRKVDVVFKDVDWTGPYQPHSQAARLIGGVPLSPTSVPMPDQMSVLEVMTAFGSDCYGWLEWLEEEGVIELFNELDAADEIEWVEDLLEFNYWACRQSDIGEETWLEINPFESWPKTA